MRTAILGKVFVFVLVFSFFVFSVFGVSYINTLGNNQSFGNNVLFLDNTNGKVGVGTVSPTALLTINSSGVGDKLKIMDSVNALVFYTDAAGTSTIYTGTNQNLRFDTGGSNRVYIQGTSGYVGVNTLTPNATLDVVGKIKIGDDGSSPLGGMLKYANNVFSGYNGSAWLVMAGNGSGGSGGYWTKVVNDIYYTDGKVGVGTTSPAANLHVYDGSAGNVSLRYLAKNVGVFESNGHTTLTLKSPDTYSPGIWFGSPSDSNSAAITSYVGAGSLTNLQFMVNNSLVMTLLKGGSVGIGTTSTTARLDVRSDNIKSGYFEYSNTAGTGIGLEVYHMGNGGTAFVVGSRVAGVGSYITGLVVNNNGNVGVGTSSPAFNLDVVGDTLPTIRVVSTANSNALLTLGGGAGTNWSVVSSGSGSGYGVAKLVFADPAAPVMTLDSSTDNVGVGTTSPSEKLDVNGGVRLGSSSNTNAGTIKWSGSAFQGYNGSAWVTLNGAYTNDNSGLWTAGSGSNISKTNAAGNVGIGTTPVAKLHVFVNGAGEISRFEADSGNYIYLGSDGSGDYIEGVGSTGARQALRLQAASAGNYTAFKINAASASFAMTGGYVGIGTSSPASMLTVFTSSAATVPVPGIVRIGNYDYRAQTNKQVLSLAPGIFGIDLPGVANGAFIVNENGNVGIGTTSPGNHMNTSDDASPGLELKGIRPGILFNDTDDFESYQLSANGGLQFWNTKNKSRLMTINANGNVGIGTTNPIAVLNAAGNITNASSLGVALFENSFNNYDVNGNVSYPVATFMRDGKSGITWSSMMQIGISRFENVTTYARSQADFRLLHNSNGGYPDVTVMSLRSNGNVGIGTTSPAEKLVVNGGLGTGGLKVTGTISGNGYESSSSFLDNYNGEARIYSAGSGSARGSFSVNLVNSSGGNYTNPLFIDGTGNVGVGTISPLVNLDVYGTSGTGFLVRSDDNGSGPYMQFRRQRLGGAAVQNGDAAGGIGFLAKSSGMSEVASLGGVYTGNGSTRVGDLIFATANVNEFERMRITSNGYVGIGTSAPGAVLHVNSSNNDHIKLTRGIYTANINIGGAASDGSGQNLNLYAVDDDVVLGAGNAEVMRVTNAGNVGIGTNIPGVRLQVNGSGYPTAAIGIRSDLSGDATLEMDNMGSGGDHHEWIMHVSNASDSEFPLTFTTYRSSNPGGYNGDKMVLTHSGNVGIGITNVTTGKMIINQTTNGGYWGLQVLSTGTLAYGLQVQVPYTDGNRYAIQVTNGTSDSFVVSDAGEVKIKGVASDGTGKIVCILASGNLGTCTSALSGTPPTCTCG